ncbi:MULTISPECIES: RagB/SusD family nutrient uptake outer membrane protein [Niastella]|uniref:RagB/SusD family nutrient uptake outer membrane protein n=1 Tax=Niastella soli TaxID=2821487 RepID=A0ABS3YNI2_9BACT|nr:RagB/SusD family nutrient uptake outer membrane protein [Niastella soli]MBO9199378.1 RagB/SusD family nutrient uptake outer membrane protein [Niastella soli]
MKRIYSIPVAIAVLVIGCTKSDFLDRDTKDSIDGKNFFNTATDLQVYTNGFYEMLPNYTLYTDEDSKSDNLIPLSVDARVKGTRLIPPTNANTKWQWEDLRSINFFLQNYQKCPDEAAKLKYGGVARFFRAYFYYEKVKTYGDVPWYGKVLVANDPDLYKGRDSRKLVMDSVLADINFAVANIPKEVKLNEITAYTALLLKARICLFEGTFRKYHELGDYEKFLTEAASAASELIKSPYKLFSTGGAATAYRELFARNDQDATETILARDYNTTYGRQSVGYLMTSPTAGVYGIPKDMIDSYLMKDGTRFTDQPNYQTKGFYEEMQNRDPRLTQTTPGPDFAVYKETTREPVNLSITTTGYRVIKGLPTRDQWGSLNSYNDIIIFRFAEALLVLAEAKAELGALDQADLDNSINKLRARAGMPNLSLAAANANPDPFLKSWYPNIEKAVVNKGVILEIRRERRIELFNEGLRWDDLMRWKEGLKLMKPMVGMYFPGLGAFDFNNDGKTDVFLRTDNTTAAPAGTTSIINVNQKKLTNNTSGNFNPMSGTPCTFSEDEDRDYYYPIPTEDLTLNPNLKQSLKW